MLDIIILFHNAGYTFGIDDRLCDQLKHAKTRYENHNVLINLYCTGCNSEKSAPRTIIMASNCPHQYKLLMNILELG